MSMTILYGQLQMDFGALRRYKVRLKCRSRLADMKCKSRNAQSSPETDYYRLHDFARHAIHSTETLAVAINTMDSILQQHQIFSERRQQGEISVKPNSTNDIGLRDQGEGSSDRYGDQLRTFELSHREMSQRLQQHMQFQYRMLVGLKARSESNGLRIQNEINLESSSWLVGLKICKYD